MHKFTFNILLLRRGRTLGDRVGVGLKWRKVAKMQYVTNCTPVEWADVTSLQFNLTAIDAEYCVTNYTPVSGLMSRVCNAIWLQVAPNIVFQIECRWHGHWTKPILIAWMQVRPNVVTLYLCQGQLVDWNTILLQVSPNIVSLIVCQGHGHSPPCGQS